MTTIRICEESEARLMVRDGSFKDYVQGWSNRFPQKQKLQTIKGLHDEYGLGWKDTLSVSQAMGIDEDVFFGIGEKACLRKRNNVIELFQRVGTIWVRADGGMDALDSDGWLDGNRTVSLTLCTEEAIMNAKSVKELARSVDRQIQRYRDGRFLMSFGNHEIWEWDKEASRIQVYSNSITDKSFYYFDEDEIEREIIRYRDTYKMAFGSF